MGLLQGGVGLRDPDGGACGGGAAGSWDRRRPAGGRAARWCAGPPTPATVFPVGKGQRPLGEPPSAPPAVSFAATCFVYITHRHVLCAGCFLSSTCIPSSPLKPQAFIHAHTYAGVHAPLPTHARSSNAHSRARAQAQPCALRSHTRCTRTRITHFHTLMRPTICHHCRLIVPHHHRASALSADTPSRHSLAFLQLAARPDHHRSAAAACCG